MLPNPCFDSVTRKGCPDRHAGCAIDCPKWAAYTIEREKVYARRKVEYDTNAVLIEKGTAGKLEGRRRREAKRSKKNRGSRWG